MHEQKRCAIAMPFADRLSGRLSAKLAPGAMSGVNLWR